MVKKLFLILLLLSTIKFHAHSQNLQEWQVYPSFSTVNSISINSGVIYNATLGGIFVVENEETISHLTTMDGLHRANPSNIIYDSLNSRLIAGYIDGTLDIIDLENNEIDRLDDISRVNRFNSKRINDFEIYNERLYVSTSFGIVIYNLQTLMVESSFVNLGEFNIGTEVNDLDIADGKIYAATSQGVAVGDLDLNLEESVNWETHTESNGLPSEMVDEIKVYDSSLFILISGEIYEYDSINWSPSTAFKSSNYETLATDRNRENIAVATEDSLTIINSEGTSIIIPDLDSRITALELIDDQIYIGSSNEGLLVLNYSNSTQDQYLPTGPYLNFFSKILADENTMVATSTVEFPQSDPFNPIRGYYISKNGSWDNYNINTSSTLASRDVGSVFSIGQNDSSYFFGAWGDGVIKHNKSSDEIQVYDRGNSALVGLRSNPNYVVISGLDSDSDNNMWAISYDSEYPLNLQMDNQDDWIPFRGETGSDIYYNLFIDSHDQKWISLITNANSGLGLYVLDTGNPEDPDDDRGVKLTSSLNTGNLPDQKVNAFVEDKNGEVWIGTGRGIARFIFPEFIIEGGADERRSQWLINEDTSAVSRYLLRDVNVTTLAVNDANQKWVGSENQGLWLLNAEGSRIEQRFTVDNSDLISNNIESISINNATGEVFVATELGLISFQDIPKSPVVEMNKLKVFPNPFEYSRHNQIVIEGLSDETTVKILGVDGVVVNELTGIGGRINWDGFDYNGNQLGSGVYFVVAYEDDGRERGMGKVVIIR